MSSHLFLFLSFLMLPFAWTSEFEAAFRHRDSDAAKSIVNQINPLMESVFSLVAKANSSLSSLLLRLKNPDEDVEPVIDDFIHQMDNSSPVVVLSKVYQWIKQTNVQKETGSVASESYNKAKSTVASFFAGYRRSEQDVRRMKTMSRDQIRQVASGMENFLTSSDPRDLNSVYIWSQQLDRMIDKW